jgi:hypothetical protein
MDDISNPAVPEPPPVSAPAESPARRTLRRVLRTIAVVGLVVILIPGYSLDKIGDMTKRSFSLGLPFSPWLQFKEEHTQAEAGAKHTTHMGVEFLSISFLIGVIACAANWGAKKLRPKTLR